MQVEPASRPSCPDAVEPGLTRMASSGRLFRRHLLVLRTLPQTRHPVAPDHRIRATCSAFPLRDLPPARILNRDSTEIAGLGIMSGQHLNMHA